QAGLLAKCLNRVVVEARPGVFPAFEVRHPIRNIDIDPIDSGARNLPDPLHVDLAPGRSIGADPDIFVTLSYPEWSSPAENCRLAGDLSLQPIRMFFGQ